MTLPVKLAVFDLDGTLIDSLPDLADCGRVFLAEAGLGTVSDAQVRAMIGDGVRVLVRRLLTHAGQNPDDATLDTATARYMALYTPRASRLSRPFPGIIEVLETFRHSGIAMAVCTNKPALPAQDILRACHIEKYFSAICGGDTFPVRKPDPNHVLGTIAEAKGQPDTSVMIGDSINDVTAARKAGIPSVFVTWGYGNADAASGADRIISDPHELIALAG
ncbi:phosphoglycolate phosphatase [Acetobacter sp. AN02]|uniref:phosphoglycolate phosphatase n=1 Tax=Acetobacter sp. AN02 TaxID=2894186 RepID=UPI00243434C1|nr:phosphoglycolate phosphatase [Acetobacter sp. AN02]MDG6095187.1 phosphoglycolate phosphatase [Acetobacter sp. AN02]